MSASILKLSILTVLFFIGSGFSHELHLCFPLEYNLNEDRSAIVVCRSEQEFIIPGHINSPDILRQVIKANKSKSFKLYFQTDKDEHLVIKVVTEQNSR
ncbi:hypothetical protein MRY82_01225 [bacterium]|nr:hypothetical protein [bacterium]